MVGKGNNKPAYYGRQVMDIKLGKMKGEVFGSTFYIPCSICVIRAGLLDVGYSMCFPEQVIYLTKSVKFGDS
jgi:hypothetical protein